MDLLGRLSEYLTYYHSTWLLAKSVISLNIQLYIPIEFLIRLSQIFMRLYPGQFVDHHWKFCPKLLNMQYDITIRRIFKFSAISIEDFWECCPAHKRFWI